MQKPLIGLLSAVALFLLVAFFLHFRSPGTTRAPGRYQTPEDIVADYANVMDRMTSTATINAALTDYSLCRAFRKGSPDRCGEIDRLNPSVLKFDTCLPRYRMGLMLKDLVGASGGMENCVWVRQYRDQSFLAQTGEEEHDETDMIEKYCQASVPFWRTGKDFEGFCRLEGRMLALDDDSPEEGYKRCIRSTRYFTGDSAKCSGGSSGFQAFCIPLADLVQALRSQDPGAVKGTVHGPLVDSEADCRVLADKVMRLLP